MAQDQDKIAAQEQLERRRLARLVEALPVFSGFVSPEGHLMQARPKTEESFLWGLPAFAYGHDSITQIVDLCERASKGERIQIERPYLKNRTDQADIFGRALLTLSPIRDDAGHVEEMAVSLLDCDDAGLAPHDAYAKSRLSEANARIESMLSLAQTVIEVSIPKNGNPASRDILSSRLDALASVIDMISDPDLDAMSVDTLVKTAVETVPDELKSQRLQLITSGGSVPLASIPLMILLLSELISNARRHGAWRDGPRDRHGTVSIQSEVLDGVRGRVLRLHWIEDGGPSVSAVLGRGFGLVLAEKLFPQVTGGTSRMHNSEDGLSWTFELPIAMSDDDLDFDGIDV